MTAQSFSSLGTAYILVGHEAVLRVDPHVESGRFGLDTYKETASLRGLGNSEARNELPKVRSMFIDEGLAERFDPYKKL